MQDCRAFYYRLFFRFFKATGLELALSLRRWSRLFRVRASNINGYLKMPLLFKPITNLK